MATMPPVEQYLSDLPGVRGENVRKFHAAHLDRFNTAKGSSGNHQDWHGGYRDHLTQVMGFGRLWASAFIDMPNAEFTPKFDSFVIAAYFHDIEKLFKYSHPSVVIDKDVFIRETLPEKWEFILSEQELLAIRHAHGEGDDYRKGERVMKPLGAWLHAADILSARWLYGCSVTNPGGIVFPH